MITLVSRIDGVLRGYFISGMALRRANTESLLDRGESMIKCLGFARIAPSFYLCVMSYGPSIHGLLNPKFQKAET